MEKLKQCPFCGGEAKVYKWNLEWHIRCTHCTADLTHFDSKEEAVEAWNRRADNGNFV